MASRGVLPAGPVTGIGSLPLTDPDAAVRFVAEVCPTLPFWPQLPRRCREEGLVEQGLGPLAQTLEPRPRGHAYRVKPGGLAEALERLERGPAELQPSRAAGFFAFEEALAAGAFPQAAALKGQVEGPITLAFHLFHRDRPFAGDPLLVDALTSYVCRLARWQIGRLQRAGRPVILFVDEPGLVLIDREREGGPGADLVRALADVLAAIRDAGARSGLHCCAPFPWALLRRARPEVLSFDAHRDLEAFCADPDARAFFQEGGRVAFGLVPTWPRVEGLSEQALFGRWLRGATDLGDAREVARRSIITAACGLGLLNPSAARASFALSHGVARLVQRVAASPPEAAPNG